MGLVCLRSVKNNCLHVNENMSFLRLNVSLKIAFSSGISTESGHLNEIKGIYKICMKMYFKKHLFGCNYNKSVEDVFQITFF